ncbi:Glyoxalase [Candidatus Desulfarcum epimagneticum]|uniref:Glyoxalase n=1 Tax=uncultured Desulfobacteraceae bacterium TaxID=218296 RepID=A0A484HGM2_9BACT|nr:Glyoxalase [uncultured Desulfobacteraceae bacterium]
MPSYSGINHLAMVTPDMDETIRFWRDFLGMRLVAGLGNSRFRHYFFEISETDLIAFFEWPDVEKNPPKDHGAPVKGPFSFDHVSIGVESDEDLHELIDRFRAAGMWVSEIIDHGFIHSIYAFDPNHIPIEFSAPTQVDIRKNPMMKDRHPSETTLEGPDPVPGRRPEAHRAGKGGRDGSGHGVFPGEGIVFAGKTPD